MTIDVWQERYCSDWEGMLNMAIDLISKIAEKAQFGNTVGSVLTKIEKNKDLIISLPVNSIKYHPKNHIYFRDLDRAMKDKLMEDMRDNGQINPIIVRKNEDNTYTVLAGHQRLIAARRLNWQQIKAIVIEVSEFEAEKLLIRDNLFRRHMGGMELARALEAYSKMSDNQTRKSIRQIAEEIGENRNTVHFYMKLNNLIPEIQQLIDDKRLTPTAAQVFTTLCEEEQRSTYEALGESLLGMKKKVLEDEIRRQFDEVLTKLENEKVEIKCECDRLLLDLREKESDIGKYQKQADTYRQQAELCMDKAVHAGLPEEIRNVLSKLDVIDSVIASISLGEVELNNTETLFIILKRYDHVLEYISTCYKRINDVINMKSTTKPVESVDNVDTEKIHK